MVEVEAEAVVAVVAVVEEGGGAWRAMTGACSSLIRVERLFILKSTWAVRPLLRLLVWALRP